MRALLPIPLVLATLAFLACASGSAAQAPAPAPPPEEVDKLVEELGDPSFPVRQRAFAQLQRIGVDASLPSLQKGLQSGDPEVVNRAWRLIDSWAGQGKVPALLFQLASARDSERATAAENLGKMGPSAKQAIPALTAASRDKSATVSLCAREALRQIEAVPELTLEVICLDEQAKVGADKRYLIEITNTGTAAATNVRINAVAPTTVTVVGVGGVDSRQDGQRIVSVPLELPANAKMRLEVRTKVQKEGAAPLMAEALADQLPNPVRGADNMPAQTGAGAVPPRAPAVPQPPQPAPPPPAPQK